MLNRLLSWKLGLGVAGFLFVSPLVTSLAEEAAGRRPTLSFEMGTGGVPLVLMTFPDVPGASFKAWCYESTVTIVGKPASRDDGTLVLLHRNNNDPAMLIETTVTPSPGKVSFVARALVDRTRKPEGSVGRWLPYLNICFQERGAANFGAGSDPYPELIRRHFIFTTKGRTFLLDTDRQPVPGKPADHLHNNPPWVQIYTAAWKPPVTRKHWAGYSGDRYVLPIIGTVSKDGRHLVALANNGQCGNDDGLCNAWHDCLHANPSWLPVDGESGEDKRWRLNVYCMPNDPQELIRRAKVDFPEWNDLPNPMSGG